jgi:hypothetical protein
MRPVPAVQLLVVAEDEEVAADAAVPQPLALQCLRSQVQGQAVQQRSPLPGLNLLPGKVAEEARLLLKRVRRRAAEAAVVALVVVAVELRPAVAVVAARLVVLPIQIRFRARRSSTCCWRPVWM